MTALRTTLARRTRATPTSAAVQHRTSSVFDVRPRSRLPVRLQSFRRDRTVIPLLLLYVFQCVCAVPRPSVVINSFGFYIFSKHC